jgi:hypothetical protein
LKGEAAAGGLSCTLQEFFADGGGQFPAKTVTTETTVSPKFTTKKDKD